MAAAANSQCPEGAPVATPRTRKLRLDDLLVERGLSPDVDSARRTIWSGEVMVDGELADQPAAPVAENASIRLRARHRYATRGGEKLDEALTAFGVSIEGRCAVDVGASGGGFTDCLLTRGAARVYAVDVARGQLAQRLQRDPRVVDLSGRDVMALQPAELDPRPAVAVVDVTFRSLTDVLPKVMGLLAGEWEIVALVKPLHEAKLLELGQSQGVYRAVFDRLLPLLRGASVPVVNIMPSSYSGAREALEFFLHVKPPGRDDDQLRERLEAALAAATNLELRGRRRKRSGEKRRRTWRRIGPRG
jgi:23S rRNA (cytidine1920-2'-O)/16S rRNA (cytidine1409-2'-O)-methyltransferase